MLRLRAKRIGWAVLVALLTGAGVHAQASDPVDVDSSRSELKLTLSEGLEAFDRGSALLTSQPNVALKAFRDARDKFQSLVDAGVRNGGLYYNLGNAHARLGELGKAIAAYRRAQQLTPGDEQLKANLRFVRSLRRDHIEPGGKRAFIETVFSWHYSLPLRWRMTGGLAFYLLFWILLGVRMLSRRKRFGYLTVACLAVWVTLGVSSGIDVAGGDEPTEGVLIANDVVVRKGNGEGYDPQFRQPLHDGVEFALLEERGGWIHLELADGKGGWVRRSEVALY